MSGTLNAPDACDERRCTGGGSGALLALAVFSVRGLAALDERNPVGRFGTPLLFGAWVLVFWQVLTQAFEVPQVLLPAPSLIGHALVASFGVLCPTSTRPCCTRR